MGGLGSHFGTQFLGFSELWGALGPSWIQLGAQRRILEIISEASMLEGCVWGAQGMDFDGKSRPGNSQSRQQSPKERPKESQGRPKGETNIKNGKLRHLDFERPYGVLATFAAFGGTGAGKNAAETRTLQNIANKFAFGVALPRPKATLPPRGGLVGGPRAKRRDPKVTPT